VARWRPADPPWIEAPEWYRNFHPEDWDEPDAQEQTMINGSLGYGLWPPDLHEIHSRRRWGEAKYAYRRAQLALAEQEFAELLGSARRPA
jgi:hypothetical protein